MVCMCVCVCDVITEAQRGVCVSCEVLRGMMQWGVVRCSGGVCVE